MFKLFENFPQVTCGISNKADGAMSLSDENLSENFRVYFQKLGIQKRQIVRAGVGHKARVVKVNAQHGGQVIANCDGLYTDSKKLCLALTVADCYPIYFFDPQSRAAGLAHCGWRGCVSELILNMVGAFQSDPGRILAGVGPDIGACHFEIQDDIKTSFENFPGAIMRRGRKIFVNLPLIIKAQLASAGIKPENIEFAGECTYCEPDRYFSFRRDKPAKIQGLAAYISL